MIFLFVMHTQKAAFYLHRWLDESPVTYTHWGPGEPNNANGEEQCVQMNRHQGETHIDLIIYRAGLLTHIDVDLWFVKVDGTMSTVAELQATSARSSLEITTPLLHPHSPGRATALQVKHTF